MSNQNNNSAFQMIADIDGDLKDFLNVSTPEHVPVLALRNMVLFPGVVTPILIGRKSSKTLVEKAEKKALLSALYRSATQMLTHQPKKICLLLVFMPR